MGTSHASILGEATINLADYADALNPFVISLPLHGSDQGTILHVTVQLLTAKTGFREFEQQFDKGLQSNNNYTREVEPSIATSSSSELQISDVHENKIIELEKMKNERSILTMMSSGSSFQDLQRELMQLHKANEELGGMYPRFKDFTGDGNTLRRVLALEIELAGALLVKKKSIIQFQSSFLKQHSDEEAVFRSFRDINELIKDTLEIKSKVLE
ncbi:hypothetical protein L1987_22673 [Smallanthus sonchifolius]|uniref:Uncharacterized protein n=1 Tax=Smallanthus sonchifolius TaxID=185202 RepID=A0ACB9IFG7_9ASTR|nr:hypothetical protein L1987_22673 [Smallanthus sonchifolius]